MAIAGLLLAVVLLASKQLKQSERNTKRKNMVHAMAAALEEYFINNKCYPQMSYSRHRAVLVDLNNSGPASSGCGVRGGWNLSGYLPSQYSNNSTADNYAQNGMNDPNGGYEYGRLCYVSLSKVKYVLYFIPEPRPHTGGNCFGHSVTPSACENDGSVDCTGITLPAGAVQVKID